MCCWLSFRSGRNGDRPQELGPVQVNATVQAGNQALVRGTTNLPPGTLLVVTVEREDAEGFRGQAEAAVAGGGSFDAGPFGPEEGLTNGLYRLWVIMLTPADQPAEVRDVIGTTGKNLRGSLVREYEGYNTVAVSTVFRVGDGGGPVVAQGIAGRQPPLHLSSARTKDVAVRGYYRKNGTYVQPHMRSAPGSGDHSSGGHGHGHGHGRRR
jgi:hypothetical protein